MPYTVYNLPMQRTGFRPYGLTNPWSATQLNGVRAPTWYEHQVIHPFSEGGGRRLGQWQRAFSPRFLSGMGQAPTICLDQTQNTISCSDPNCTYGDCGTSGAQITIGALCLDQGENQIGCSDPNCTYGDCTSPAKRPPVTTPISPGPGPRVNAPLNLFPPTAGASTIPVCPPGYTRSAFGQCLATSGTSLSLASLSQIGPILPLIGVALLAIALGRSGR